MTRVALLAAALGVAGALGALARDALERAVMARLPAARLPLGVLAVNVLGSFLLGVLATAATAATGEPGGGTLLVAGPGFLGAFTTFSTFTVQTIRLARADAVRNVILQLGGCLAAVVSGGLAGGALS